MAGTSVWSGLLEATQLKYVDAADSMHEALGIYDHLKETGAMDSHEAKDYSFSRWQMYANAAKMYELGGQVEKSAEVLKKAGQQTAPLEPPPPPPGDQLK